MNSIKVLSIDWDYFVDCPIEFKMANFPDGGNENLSDHILDYTWVSRYGQCSKLKDVKVDDREMVALVMLLKKVITQHTKVVIADSHKDIYKYLEELRSTKMPIDLYNIDFHHDMYEFQDADVDCGNWLRMFMRADNSHDQDKFTWVRREDSELSRYDSINEGSVVGIPKDITTPFQLVFLCRSGVWSPPHLDGNFLSLCRLLNKLTNKVFTIDQKVTRNRYNKQFKGNVKSFTECYGKLLDNIREDSKNS